VRSQELLRQRDQLVATVLDALDNGFGIHGVSARIT
jgi:hypothetical protein